jgi:hypothetical protein
METVPNVEKPLLLGKGTLLVSCPRNRTGCAETMACREAGTWSSGLEVVPPSYVNVRAQSSLIREGPLLPQVVRRYLAGNEVIEKQRTGRVASVGVAVLERESWARALQGSGGIVFPSGWHRTFRKRRKSGRVKPDTNNAHR